MTDLPWEARVTLGHIKALGYAELLRDERQVVLKHPTGPALVLAPADLGPAALTRARRRLLPAPDRAAHREAAQRRRAEARAEDNHRMWDRLVRTPPGRHQ